jgi:hypothetical protein
MTHITLKQPLEKLHSNVLSWLAGITLHILRLQAWARRVWAAVINETPHHGAALLMAGDSLQGQRSLAKVLGGDMEKAMIVQKLHEWLEFNKAEGNYKNKRDGCWWTYNSYVDWCKNHFDWLSNDKFGRHIRALEKLGVIRTQQMKKRDRSKWYTVDYGRLHTLARAAGETLALMPARVRRERAPINSHHAPVNSHHADLHDDSSSNAIKKTNALTQDTERGATRRLSEILTERALTEAAPDSDSHTEVAAIVGQSKGTGDSDFVGSTPPSSAPPPIDEKAAKTWDTAYHQLSILLDRPSFDMWLKGAQLRAYRCVEGVDTYTVSVINAHAQDLLQHRYYRNIQRVVAGMGNTPVEIEFEVGI